MTIAVSDLKLFQSERMTDNADGGGQMSGTEIVSGQENQIFDDVSDVDRAAGDVSIRKVYAAVTSATADKYLDAGICVFANPADPAVSVAAFSTGSFFDERDALKNRLEQTISRGGRWHGWLWGTHLVGQRAVVLWQRPEADLPATGARLELVAKAGTVEQYNQFLWVTRVREEIRTISDEKGAFAVREVTCEIAEPLAANYAGPDPSRVDPTTASLSALFYETRYNAEAVPLFGARPLVAAAESGDFSVQVDDLYLPIVPTSLNETALPDVNPVGDSPALVAANASTVNFVTTTQSIRPNASLYCGTGILPGTLSIAVSGSTIADDNGKARLATTHVGDVDYGNGIITWNDACPNYAAASKTVTFQPAARPLGVAESAAQIVTAENQGFVWVFTLSPIPLPGTLRVSYRVANKWYVITDQGGGQLNGVDSSYGSGQLNFSTGTVTWTAGGLPDVDSEIIYLWGTPASYTARGGSAVDAPVIRGQTAEPNVMPGSVSVAWTVGATEYTLDDTTGYLIGQLSGAGGVGGINYATGEWWARPTLLPPTGTEFTIDYAYGEPLSQTFVEPEEDVNGNLTLQLTATNIIPLSVHFALPLTYLGAEDILARDITVQAIDQGDGHFWPFGQDDASINYTTGTIVVKAERSTVSARKVTYQQHVGYTKEAASGPGVYTPVFREVHAGWDRDVPVLARFPLTGGQVTVYYRTSAGASNASETVTLSQLEFDVTRGYAETLVAGSVRFTLGGSVYVETAGRIYRDPGPDTGAGALCGTLDRVSGRIRLTSWTPGGSNAVALQAAVTELAGRLLEETVFRTPVAPIKAGTVQLRYTTAGGIAKSKTVDASGLLEDSDCKIWVNYPLGVIRARFGQWKTDAALTPEEKLEPWYNPDAVVDIGGVGKIWKPTLALADSLLYNAVAQTTIPPDSTLLGLNAARLPPDGKALIFNAGRLVLIHHTDSLAQANLSPTQVIDCGRVRLYRVAIEDAAGQRLPESFFTVNRELGTVTMAADLDLTGHAGPYAIHHTVADLCRLTGVDINGTLSLNKAVSHDYVAEESLVSGVLFAGTLQARVANLFAQSTWTGVWSDSRIGSAPLAQYDDTNWPVVVSNLGAYTDRILIQFTSATAFNVIGENLGVIGTGTISVDCAPVNSLSGQPYFTIPYQGWGTGWSTGNCVRFNLIGAAYPVALIRAVQPSQPTGQDPDRVELLLIGNVDA